MSFEIMISSFVIPDRVRTAIETGPLPLFVYDTSQVRERITTVQALLDGYYYPIKACPEKGILLAALEAGAGLDLCSEGDALLAAATYCLGNKWSFTSVHVTLSLLQELLRVQAVFNADSVAQAQWWKKIGGRACGLRIAASDATSVYGLKFGIVASEIRNVAQELKNFGLTVVGLHIHESHAHRTPDDMANRLISTFKDVDSGVLKECHYINIGGGWPLWNGTPVSVDKIATALSRLRGVLAEQGFSGRLLGEPGEWVVGLSGYWAMRVSAVKKHPLLSERRIIILDTPTPIPCRPSVSQFIHCSRDGEDAINKEIGPCDLFGSANTGSDTIGINVFLGEVRTGDRIIALGQGAYVRSLIGSFNERPIPNAAIV